MARRAPWVITAGLLLVTAAPGCALAQSAITQPRLQIYAGSQHRDYLGCLNCDRFDTNSIWNGYGPFGWDNGYVGQSRFHGYFQPHGQFSACDPFAADPPLLIDAANTQYSRLNVSKTRSDSTCNTHSGAQDICAKLIAYCQHILELPQ